MYVESGSRLLYGEIVWDFVNSVHTWVCRQCRPRSGLQWPNGWALVPVVLGHLGPIVPSRSADGDLERGETGVWSLYMYINKRTLEYSIKIAYNF